LNIGAPGLSAGCLRPCRAGNSLGFTAVLDASWGKIGD